MVAILRAAYDNIVSLNVDAVVNSTSSSLLGGGGVDAAIHEAAGPQLLEACRRLGGCQVGDATITAGYRMKATYIIHTVGPIWRGGSKGEPELLASCYRRSLELAVENHARSVAFPSISTGALRYPMELAAPVAIAEVRNFVQSHRMLREIIFCCLSSKVFSLYERLLREGRA